MRSKIVSAAVLLALAVAPGSALADGSTSSDSSQEAQTNLQLQPSQYATLLQALSNIMKSASDAASAIISNMSS